MSKSAVILKFPGGEPIHVPPRDEEPPQPRRRWSAWIGGTLAVLTVIGTFIGALTRTSGGATDPPPATTIPGVRTVYGIQDFCTRHPRGLFRAEVHGVFYAGIALSGVSGELYNSGPIPPQVTLHPEAYGTVRAYRRVVVSAWPRHETDIPASAWVTLSGILSCTRPVQMEYLSYRGAAP